MDAEDQQPLRLETFQLILQRAMLVEHRLHKAHLLTRRCSLTLFDILDAILLDAIPLDAKLLDGSPSWPSSRSYFV